MDNTDNELTSDNSDSVEEDKKTSKKITKFEISAELKEKLKDLPDVLEYITRLHKYLEKQKRKIRKLKRLKKTKDADTETLPEVADFSGKTSKSLTEEITEVAEAQTQKLGYAYDETSGLYYDYNTGYYYNAEYGLYYDRNSGTYMSYNQNTKTYEFYSKVDLPVNKTDEQKPKNKLLDSKKASKRKRETSSGLEEGECSNSSDEESASQEDIDDDEEEDDNELMDISTSWPCMRIIVKKTSVPGLKEGSLHIVTYKGGSLGREGNHSIIIPDINVSKYHAKFTFDESKAQFFVTDVGSRNGTILNGKRISSSKQESEALEVVHGSSLQIGSTTLLCHIHTGHQTCGHCEPGLIQIDNKQDQPKLTNLSELHKKQLKTLRKKYGVSAYAEKTSSLAPGYTDRAQIRRDTVGSQNPHEKTHVASVTESIPTENKGFKMLAKMGWSQGQSLGKRDDGLTEPINVIANEGTAGIGSNSSTGHSSSVIASEKQKMWKKTQERFENLPEVNDLDDSV